MRLRVQEFDTPGLMLKAWLFSDRRIALNWMSNGDNTVTYRNFRNLTDKAFEMTSYPNLGRTFMDSPFQICAHFWP